MSIQDQFINQIIKNLESNGFPAKKVSFDLEKMYEVADNKSLSFNNILDILNTDHNIQHSKTVDKIIFSKQNLQAEDMKINEDMMAQAQQMMENMSEEELQNIKSMYENMSDDQRAQMMEQAKKMGLF